MGKPPTGDGVPPSEVLDRAERRLARMGAGELPRVGGGVPRVLSLVDAYAELVAVAMARAAFYGELLADQRDRAMDGEREVWEDEPATSPTADTATGLGGPRGTAGLIGYTYSVAETRIGGDTGVERVATGEAPRALVEMEFRERKEAARLIEQALKLGADLQKIEVMRGYASTVAAAMRTICAELGLDMNDEPVLRAAKRAGLAARRAVGQDDGNPDTAVGPALSLEERQAIWRRAARRARDTVPAGQRKPAARAPARRRGSPSAGG